MHFWAGFQGLGHMLHMCVQMYYVLSVLHEMHDTPMYVNDVCTHTPVSDQIFSTPGFVAWTVARGDLTRRCQGGE